MTSFVKYIIFSKAARQHPHELVPQVSWQLTDNLVPLNVFYSHSESKAFMEIRQPLAFRPTVKASSLPQRTVSVSLYVWMHFFVYIKFVQATPSLHWLCDIVVSLTTPIYQHSISPILSCSGHPRNYYIGFGCYILTGKGKSVCPGKNRKNPGKGEQWKTVRRFILEKKRLMGHDCHFQHLDSCCVEEELYTLLSMVPKIRSQFSE